MDLIRRYQLIYKQLCDIQDRHRSARGSINDITVEVDLLTSSLIQLQTSVDHYAPLFDNSNGEEKVEISLRVLDVLNRCGATLVALSSQVEGLKSSGSTRWTHFISKPKRYYHRYTIGRHITPLRTHRAAIDSLIQALDRYVSISFLKSGIINFFVSYQKFREYENWH